MTTDDRHQRAKQYWPIRRASNKESFSHLFQLAIRDFVDDERNVLAIDAAMLRMAPVQP